MKPTIEEIKERYKNAKTVRCLTSGVLKPAYNGRVDDIYDCFFLDDVDYKTNGSYKFVCVWSDGEFAEIVEYKDKIMKVGDKVRVIKRLYGHGFDIGEVVFITRVTDSNYECSNNNERWKLEIEELELIKETKTPEVDPIVTSVMTQLLTRSQLGISKYGTTLADNNTDNFLQHLKEELMDAVLYIQKLQNK